MPVSQKRRRDDTLPPLLSVVVPMYNEEEGAELFFRRIEPILQSVTDDYEIICVDDGSSAWARPATSWTACHSNCNRASAPS